MHTLLAALADFTREHPRDRKLLVVPDVNYGRELLLALARVTGGWVGWQPVTLRALAETLAFVPLANVSRRAADDVEITMLAGEAIDWMVATGRGSDAFRERATGLGFRTAVRDAMLELRIAGAVDAVRRVAPPSTAAADTLVALSDYERRLASGGLVDPAGLFALALASFDAEAPFVLDGRIAIAPGLTVSGLPGHLLDRLVAHGAVLLAGDEPVGVARPARAVEGVFAARGVEPAAIAGRTVLGWAAAPDGLVTRAGADESLDTLASVEYFHAASPAAELREVLRRVIAEGAGWDEVEIVTTDPDVYGVELDGLCARLGIRASLLHGVPLGRTRIGRALARYLQWIETGLPAAQLRAALEAGEIEPPTSGATYDPGWLPAVASARTLRRLGIGWGRERYEAALRTLTDGTYVAQTGHREDDDEAAAIARRARRAREAAPLARLIAHLLAVTPLVPALGSIDPVRASPARLAGAALGYLDLVRARGQAEQRTMARLRGRLERLAETDGPDRGFGGAMATLRDALADLRAWSDVSEQHKPWAADGGALHLTDLAHAGTTGRPRVFVVGLDADRASGARLQDPILVDAVRHAAAEPGLPPTTVRADEHRWQMLAALAALRGDVTLSYSVCGSDKRDAGPCAALLGSYRATSRNPSASYEDFLGSLGTPSCAVPQADVAALDGRDIWLAALADDALLLDGAGAVRAAFPRTGHGLAAGEAFDGAALTAYHGLVPAAADVFDPRTHPDRPLSPSSLERLAQCPLGWFYHAVLRLRVPDDPAYDPDAWLDALQRGSLLHAVYEGFGREYLERQAAITTPAARARLQEIVGEAIAAMEAAVPPPSRTVFEAECTELRRSADAFLEMERAALARGDGCWESFETEFGFAEPAFLVLPDGRHLAVRGRIDRLDRLSDGTLRIVDYKTGKASRFARRTTDAPFKGGRQLQPAVYLLAAGASLGAPVTAFEYRFPTKRGQNQVVPYAAVEAATAGNVIDSLLQHVTDGAFVPTTDSADCRYCDFQTICHVRTGRGAYPTIESPPAAWAAAHAADLPEYQGMNARRGDVS